MPEARPQQNSIELEARRAARFRSGRLKPLPKPSKTRTVALANQKGGVGKTTSTVNIAWALSKRGLRVLVIDLDPQGNASTALSAEHRDESIPTVYEVICGEVSPNDAIQQHPENKNLYCMPSNVNLAGAEIELTTTEDPQFRLAQILDNEQIKEGNYDYIFIDCPPSLGLLTINALTAANEIVIPIQCEFYALEGVAMLTDNVERIRMSLNPNLRISAILLTMSDRRTNLSKDVEADVRKTFGDLVLEHVIPRNVRVSEAPSHGKTVIDFDPGSPGSAAYMDAAIEFSQREPE